MRNESDHDWILLIHQLPHKPTSLRVRTWRRLQKLGAVAIKNSVYVLPFNEKTSEDFQWLKQEIESAGGEASVFRAGAVEGAADEEIITSFRNVRDEEYALVTAELDGLTGTLNEQKRGGHLSAGRISGYETELDKLHKQLERIIATDFFNAAGRSAAVTAYERCQAALRATQRRSKQLAKAKSTKSTPLDLAQYQGRRWVTRRNLFIDRLASCWLIKRFIDKRPRFHFVAEGEIVEGGIGFDMYGAEFTHQGEDCTFETMIKQFGLVGDVGLQAIAEIVHDIDLKDNKFNRLEAAGLSLAVRGLADLLKDDHKLIQQCNPIFDGLYELLSRTDKTASGLRGNEKRSRRTRKTSKRSRRG
jgi:CRISPR/Cas system-associated endoribonuclease Cas2